MSNSKIWQIFLKTVRQDFWPSVLIDNGAVSHTLASQGKSARLPQEYLEFITCGICEVPSNWELYGVTQGSASLQWAQKEQSIWLGGVPARYTVFGSLGGGDEYVLFDFNESDVVEQVPVLKYTDISNKFDSNKVSRYADSFSGFICQYTEAMLCAIDKMARNNISMLSDVLSSLNSKSAAGGKCDKIQKAYAKFALLVANDREYSATFLSCDAIGQTYLGIAGVPEQRRVFEKTLLDRPALPYGVKIQVQQGKYYGKYRPTIKGGVNGSTRNCKNDFFVFCVINNSTLYAYQVDNNTEPDKWLIYQIHLKQSGACDYPKYYARTHCEFVIRILLKYLENKIKRTELYKAELYNSLS